MPCSAIVPSTQSFSTAVDRGTVSHLPTVGSAAVWLPLGQAAPGDSVSEPISSCQSTDGPGQDLFPAVLHPSLTG